MENNFNLKQFLAEGKLLNEIEINLPGNLSPNQSAMGVLWRLATPEDDVYTYDQEYVWIEDNVKDLLTQLYKSLGEDDEDGIDEVTSSITYEMSPTDYDIEGTVQKFLQGFEDEYKKFGLEGLGPGVKYND